MKQEKKRKILITGATGLLGLHLIKEFQEHTDYEILACFRNEKFFEEQKQLLAYIGIDYQTNWVKFQLKNPSQNDIPWHELDGIIHCAALVSFDKEDEEQMLQTNVIDAFNLARIAKQNKINWFFQISSIAALGRNNKHEIYTENNVWINDSLNSIYAISKYESEQKIIELADDNFSVFTVHPGVILGPCVTGNSSSKFFTMSKGKMMFYTQGGNGFVDVRDVSRAIRLMIKQDLKSEKMILVGANMSFRNLFTTIRKQVNLPAPKHKAPKVLTELAWRIEKIMSILSKRKPRINQYSAAASQRTSVYDNSKSLTIQGFSYTNIDNTIDYCWRGMGD